MLLLPTRMPRKMKIVKGFQGLDAGLAGLKEERRGLGRREVQNPGWAIFGRWEVDADVSRARVVAEKDRGRS